ncbi:MAG: CDP-alcohol phosphatidyltransferase family protein [Actinomycetota bacterium]|nr:CDP-alcohol phosphatidyltransferase family protein [Actinomycetota bacterium]
MARTSTTLPRVKHAYTNEVRRLAGTSMNQLERTRLSPNALTAAGVGLSVLAAVVVYFENSGWWLYWLAALLFVVGSLLDILDGALARSRGTGTAFGAFIDSTVDRIGEGFMLGAIGLVLMRDGIEWGLALAFAAVVGSFLVSYTRARAESLGLAGDVGIGSRAERVVVITGGLVLAPIHELVLPSSLALLTLTAWVTVVQRVVFVHRQLYRRYELDRTDGA